MTVQFSGGRARMPMADITTPEQFRQHIFTVTKIPPAQQRLRNGDSKPVVDLEDHELPQLPNAAKVIVEQIAVEPVILPPDPDTTE